MRISVKVFRKGNLTPITPFPVPFEESSVAGYLLADL